jgi:hypothetical protein
MEGRLIRKKRPAKMCDQGASRRSMKWQSQDTKPNGLICTIFYKLLPEAI